MPPNLQFAAVSQGASTSHAAAQPAASALNNSVSSAAAASAAGIAASTASLENQGMTTPSLSTTRNTLTLLV